MGNRWRSAGFTLAATGKTRRRIAGSTVAALLLAAQGALGQTPPAPSAVSWPFRGVSGPDDTTTIAPERPTPWTSFDAGASNRLAILLTDTASGWLGMAHALETIGIPFIVTQDWSEAVRHRVVLIYPDVSGATLSPAALHALVALAHGGGTLLANDVLVGGMNQVFGFARAVPSRSRFHLRWGATSLTARFTDSLERDIRLGDPARQTQALWTTGYTGAADPVAVFDDGTAAITRRTFDGGGVAYALGVDIGALCLLSQDGRDQYIARHYADGYEPVLDVFLRLLRAIYRRAGGDAVTLGTVPDGRALAVLLTHDIDYRYSLPNALTFAAWEHSQGLQATYFVQTKYVTDWEDIGFFDTTAVREVRTLDSLGMEIGSHSVAHARTFNTMPTGTGSERYPEYRPFIAAANHTEGATVLGELRVSAFLLEHATGKAVVSFRPGYLRDPWVLPQTLEATGYGYSSAFTADNALSHFPLHLNYDRSPGEELPLFDFPITIEDGEPPALMQRLPDAMALADRLARYGATFVLLLHPNVIEPKLTFEKVLVDSLRRDRAWFGTVGEYGAFWAARARATVDVADQGTDRLLTLGLPARVHSLVLQLPAGWRLAGLAPGGMRLAPVEGGLAVTADEGVYRLRFVAP